jgi:hypothetical protein
MTFEEMLDQALAMLQRRGRVTYRALKLQFSLDDDHLEALKDELLYAHPSDCKFKNQPVSSLASSLSPLIMKSIK